MESAKLYCSRLLKTSCESCVAKSKGLQFSAGPLFFYICTLTSS